MTSKNQCIQCLRTVDASTNAAECYRLEFVFDAESKAGLQVAIQSTLGANPVAAVPDSILSKRPHTRLLRRSRT